MREAAQVVLKPLTVHLRGVHLQRREHACALPRSGGGDGVERPSGGMCDRKSAT